MIFLSLSPLPLTYWGFSSLSFLLSSVELREFMIWVPSLGQAILNFYPSIWLAYSDCGPSPYLFLSSCIDIWCYCWWFSWLFVSLVNFRLINKFPRNPLLRFLSKQAPLKWKKKVSLPLLQDWEGDLCKLISIC